MGGIGRIDSRTSVSQDQCLPRQQEAGAGHGTLIFRTSVAFDVCCLCCFGNCVACWRAESTANLRQPTDDATRTAGISATHSQCQVASGTATHSFRASRTDAGTSPAKGCNSTGNGSRPRPRNGSRPRPRNGSRPRPRNGSRPRPRNGSRPRPRNGSRPRPRNGSRPRPRNGSRPRPRNGSRPRPRNGSR